ncbi:hypothetical protein ADM96_05425 [Burkholderia sp. ST111]|nr:hypothetical protein ADM96_05425 [Burkholderia sp. ST111]
MPLSLDWRTTSKAPPHAAFACCEQESDPTEHWTSVVGRPSDRNSGALLLQLLSMAIAGSASAAQALRAKEERLRFI